MLNYLRAVAPQDDQISQLQTAAKTWAAVLSPAQDSASIPSKRSTLTTGVLNSPIVQTDRYVVTGRWCGSVDELQPAFNIPLEYTDEAAASEVCSLGRAILTVHDAKDLRFIRFVPIMSSDGVIQGTVDTLAVEGEIAFVTIEGPDTGGGPVGEVAVDLRSGGLHKSKTHSQITDEIAVDIESEEHDLEWSSPDGRYRFVDHEDNHRSNPHLVRIDNQTGERIRLVDGFGEVAPAVPSSPYRYRWRDRLLEVRDATTGSFVCAWPGLIDERSLMVKLLVNADNDTLVIVATQVAGNMAPSALIDVRTLDSRSRDCARATTGARDALEAAMRTLALE